VKLIMRMPFASIAMLVLATSAATASACEAPKIPRERVSALSRAIGRASFQADPSTVIVRLTFTGPDTPPVAETLYSGGDSRFTDGVLQEAKLLRSPCASVSAPVTSTETFRVGVVYTGMQGRRVAEPRLKGELDLVDVVKLIKDLKSERVRFDLREMNCPFAVRFAPFRPYLPNWVEEIAQHEPSREPLFAWLRTITLDIPGDMMVTAIGQPSLLYVPCAVLDLS
jgi:hypothetical protein